MTTKRESDSNDFPGIDIVSNTRIWLGGHNTDARAALETILQGTTRPPTGPLNAAFITPIDVDEAAYFADKLRPRLKPDSNLWIVGLDSPNLTDKLREMNYTKRTETIAAPNLPAVVFTLNPSAPVHH